MILQRERYEVWLSRDDDPQTTMVVITAWLEDGQSLVIGSREFGRFSTWEQMAAWVWHQMTLDDEPFPG